MRAHLALATALLALTCATPCFADAQAEKDARAAFQAGNELLSQGDYVAALAKFRDAYALWPNPKILLNIGTTLRQLGREAEAGDVYERYLNDPGADPERRAEVAALLVEIDTSVAKLRIEVEVPGTRLLLDGQPIGVPSPSAIVRAAPGSHVVTGEVEGAKVIAETFSVRAGETKELVVHVVPVETAKPPPPIVGPDRPEHPTDAVARSGETQVAALLRTDVDARGRGTVIAPGLAIAFGDHVAIAATALVGRTKGFEPSFSLFFLGGRLRPGFVVAMPTFFVDGAHPGLRGGLALIWDPSKRFALFAQGTAAHFFSAPASYESAALIGSLGLEVRL